MKVDVSVIVPCFNQAGYVAQAVRSALEQTLRSIELIVVDDGSSDDPATALGSLLEDSRVQFIRQENRGVAEARNVAIARSRGRFLHFLDADDWIAPDMLRTLTEVMSSRPSLGMAYCDITHVDASGMTTDAYSVGEARAQLNGNLLPSLLVGGYFPPVAVLASREAIDKVAGFDRALGGCCDWDIWSQIASLGYEAEYVDQKLAFYRIHDKSMSRDATHMSETMRLAVRKLTRLHPDQVADAINLLIATNVSWFKKAGEHAADNQRLVGEIAWHQRQVISLEAARTDAEERFVSQAEHHRGAIEWQKAQNVSLERALAVCEQRIAELGRHEIELARQADASRELLETSKAEVNALAHHLEESLRLTSDVLGRLRRSTPFSKPADSDSLAKDDAVVSPTGSREGDMHLAPDLRRDRIEIERFVASFERHVAFLDALERNKVFRLFSRVHLLPPLPSSQGDPS